MTDHFKALGVSARLIQGLDELGITQPTEVQRQAIPYLIEEGGDLLVQAQTGTGKTAAFGLPLLMKMDAGFPRIQGVVVAPTRELAKQIQKQLFRFTKYTAKIFSETLCGGDDIQGQVAALRRPTHIVVATPGRLLDLHKRKALDLSRVKYVVLDEADEMLSMGFKEELGEILGLTNARLATWLFSATFPKALDELTSQCMGDSPKQIKIDRSHLVNPDIDHRYVLLRREEKDEWVANFVQRRRQDRGLIFCRTKAGAITLAKKLAAMGVPTDALQGDLSQLERDKLMRAFRKQRLRVLVATDVVARGIDVEGLAFVIHYQLPDQLEYYTHRSGRTGRAGRKGLSIVLIPNRERRKLEFMESELGISFDRF